MTINLDDLKELNEAGIELSVHLFDGYIDLTPKEVIEYIKEPELFEAKNHNVKPGLWREWKEHCNNPCCHAITKKGSPCMSQVHKLDLVEFTSKNCQVFCAVHENSGTNEL